MLRCADDSFYAGVATDVERRLQQHNGELAGGARYTSGRRPVELVWTEAAKNRSEAQQREFVIKKMSRSEKMTLI